MNFYKYQGAGNDFILVEDRGARDHVKHLCDRHFGIGADGVILLEESSVCDVMMRIFNSDGREAAMCGNALRCVVVHLQKENISIETAAGVCLGRIDRGVILATLPYAKELSAPFVLDNGSTCYHADTGVPHLIVFEEDFETIDFERDARALRFDQRFVPAGVNVSYVKVKEGAIFIRTYERGVEKETLACGTAAAAAVFIVRKNDKKERFEYTVYPVSKKALKFTFDENGKLWMEGPARLVFTGEVSVQNTYEIEGSVL
jgi:diaminopimelate epimerase